MADATPLEHRVIEPANWSGLVSQFRVIDGVLQMDTASVVQTARKNKEETGDRTPLTVCWFYVGDGNAYEGDDKGNVWLYVTDAANNPAFKSPQEFAHQLKTQNDYFLQSEESNPLRAKAKVSNSGVVAFNLSQLQREGRLKRDTDEYSGIEVKTETLKDGREAVLKEYGDVVTKLIDTLHGNAIYGEDGIGASLFTEGKAETVVGVLTPTYVLDKLKGREAGSMFARASKLNSFVNHSNVSLNNWNLGDHRFARGVVKSAAEGGAPQIDYDGIISALKIPNFDPKALARILDPTSAGNLSAALTAYVSPK